MCLCGMGGSNECVCVGWGAGIEHRIGGCVDDRMLLLNV